MKKYLILIFAILNAVASLNAVATEPNDTFNPNEEKLEEIVESETEKIFREHIEFQDNQEKEIQEDAQKKLDELEKKKIPFGSDLARAISELRKIDQSDNTGQLRAINAATVFAGVTSGSAGAVVSQFDPLLTVSAAIGGLVIAKGTPACALIFSNYRQIKKAREELKKRLKSDTNYFLVRRPPMAF